MNICSKCKTSHQKHDLIQLKVDNIKGLEKQKRKQEKALKEYEELLLTSTGNTVTEIKIQINQINTILSLIKQLDCLVPYIEETIITYEDHSTYELMQLCDSFNKEQYKLRSLKEMKVVYYHTGKINYIVQLSDGQLASCSEDTTICLSNIRTGNSNNILKGHTDHVNHLLELSDGQLASCSNDTTIRFWDTTTGKCNKTLHGHDQCVSHLIESKDGILISRSWINIRIWKITTGQCLFVLKHRKIIYYSLLLNDNQLASSINSSHYSIKLWNTTTGKCNSVLKGHRKYVYHILQLKNNQSATCSVDDTIKIWNMETGQWITSIYEDSTISDSLCKSYSLLLELKDGRLAFSSIQSTIIKVWNYKTGECTKLFEGHKLKVYGFIQLNDGLLASWLDDRTIRLLNVDNGQCMVILEGRKSLTYSLIQLDNGQIASSSHDKSIGFWKYFYD